MCVAACGVFIYFLTGFLCMINGGRFLEYEALPFSAEHLPFSAEHGAELHATGILMIETGVTIGVMATIITILEAVVERNSLNGRS